jgi:GH25 family lysozyme M1 (1,4-beta-N-acetylmuramidase)
MIRCGYRGYTKGVITKDKYFTKNIRGALNAGLEVGVYFFSQATNVWEAEEEADYVLQAIRGYNVTYPVVFDWEYITGNSQARTNTMQGDDITRCAGAFCDMVAQAGYDPVIYFNKDLGYLGYRLDKLTDYTFWLAEYETTPSFHYDFDLWQYTHRGTVPGIEGSVDLNLDLRGL